MSIAPVIYIFFNRPDVMERSFAAIRAARPARLYLIADGPRPHRHEDSLLCSQARALVERGIDWPCEVTRDYASENLGCGLRVSSGLTAAFAALGEAIVVEDDIAPHPEFFPFCTRMLHQFRGDLRIHAICGFNPLNRYQPHRGAAAGSLHSSIWGWASWQQRWQDYRFDLSEWSDPNVQAAIRKFTADELLYAFYRNGFDETAAGRLDSWDFQWSYTMLRHQRHVLTSTTNLIENIGFHSAATHTHEVPKWAAGLRIHRPLEAPQRHPLHAPDPLHDRLIDFVVMSDSRLKIVVARAAARSQKLTQWVAGR